MKQYISIFIFTALLCLLTFKINAAPLTGTKNIPGDYATLLSAITDLNTQGVGSGGVTLNLFAGNPQTAPLGGYLIGGTGSMVLTTSSDSSTILINGNGNTITAPSPQTAGVLTDGILKLVGADWVTITGFTMMENPSNTITSNAINNMTEWGVAVFVITPTDGAQHNTIKINTIDLNKSYQNTIGIFSSSVHSLASATLFQSDASSDGQNSWMTVAGNTITDVNFGIFVFGSYGTDQNDGLTIGGSPLDANSITNFGTASNTSGYAYLFGTVNGIAIINAKNFNVSYNTITRTGSFTSDNSLRGIYIRRNETALSGNISNVISNNSISLKCTGNYPIYGIISDTNVSSTTSLDINNNNFSNFGHSGSSSSLITYISYRANTDDTINVNDNTFTNDSVNTTGTVTFISRIVRLGATGVENINRNKIVTRFIKSGAGGNVIFLQASGNSFAGSSITNDSNNFSNVTVTGATGISFSNGDGGSAVKKITNNTFDNIKGGTSSIVCLSMSNGAACFISNNKITNITNGATITGINLFKSSSTPVTVSNNLVRTLSATSGTVSGITISSPSIAVYKNKVYDLTSVNAIGALNGLTISGGITVDVYNNLIGNLFLPMTSSTSVLLRGINITSTTTLSNINLSFNTVYLNTSSSGAEFSSTGIYHTISTTSTTAQLNMRNNIITNLSTPSGAGITSAYMRSSTTLTNYGAISNNNLFYAGTPTSNNLIFYDGTNSDQTLSSYKSRVAPRDSNSISENPNFLSLNGSDINFLHIDPAITGLIIDGGTSVSGITDDYDGELRNEVSPDIGADELSESITLNLVCLIEGFYDNVADNMIQDTSMIYLRINISPYLIVDSAKSVLDSTGNGTFAFSNAVSGTPYYIIIKHRNSVETWSAAGQSFTSGSLIYDFTTAANKAYGNNLTLKGSRYCIYNGDVNLDGNINLSDVITIYNDISNFVTGYTPTDINGDNQTDLSDLIVSYNNSVNFVSMSRP